MTLKQLLVGAYMLMLVSNVLWFAAGLFYGRYKGQIEATKEMAVYLFEREGTDG